MSALPPKPYGGPALTPAEIAEYEQHADRESWAHKDLVAFDQFLNVITGGLPDETISARSQRLADAGNKFGKFMIWWLDKIQARHGQRAQAGDLARSEQVEDTEAESLGKQPE